MLLKKSCILASMILALSTSALAQSSSDDDDWLSADSPSPSTTSEKPAGTYDGSTDSEFANDEEYASAYARYKTETTSRSEISRQRKEGFSQSVFVGAKLQGGFNTFLGSNSDGWGAGWNAGAGLIIKISMFTKNFSLVPELTFNYRQYNYEKDMDVYTNKAQLNIMLFELPIMFRYTFEQNDFFAAAGLHLGLKLMGDTEFSSEAKGGVVTNNSTKSTNTFVSTNMEVGLAIEGGYMLTRSVHLHLRVVQCFTNLLNQGLTVEPSFSNSTLLTFYSNLGISFLF
ncbi:MAG: outer membrane beta-barrel protein [Fibrobacter sp.]|nr:outer membrane beta-barrel protein [Fibrobacter sp.]MBQ5462720.1 outer membrane beta-barrel protein [Fibrobacter sp.]